MSADYSVKKYNMWIATIKEKTREFDKIKINISFSDGNDSFNELYYTTIDSIESIKEQVQNKIDNLDKLDVFYPTIKEEELKPYVKEEIK